MTFEGRVWKDGKHWLIEAPELDAMTQGHSRKDAHAMMKDLVETMADRPGFEATVEPIGDDRVEIGANDIRVLLALFLRRQRERHGVSLAQAADRLAQRSRNAYARYERGEAVPSVEKLEELLRAVAPEGRLVWRLAS